MLIQTFLSSRDFCKYDSGHCIGVNADLCWFASFQRLKCFADMNLAYAVDPPLCLLRADSFIRQLNGIEQCGNI